MIGGSYGARGWGWVSRGINAIAALIIVSATCNIAATIATTDIAAAIAITIGAPIAAAAAVP